MHQWWTGYLPLVVRNPDPWPRRCVLFREQGKGKDVQNVATGLQTKGLNRRTCGWQFVPQFPKFGSMSHPLEQGLFSLRLKLPSLVTC